MTHILLVDDGEENLAFLRSLLNGSGFVHESAIHGADALAKARRSPPSLIISDLLMPVMDGYALLREWKSDPHLKTIPFLVYTATYTDWEDEQIAMDLGADAFMQKADDAAELVSCLEHLIAQTGTTSAASPRRVRLPEAVQLTEYNAALVRKLEARTLQLHVANRALQQEIVHRRDITTTQIAVLNALAAHVALVDETGMIVTVNDAWRRFARSNDWASAQFGVGENYLTVCDEASGADSFEAKDAAAGIRAVLSGETLSFSLEYPCHRKTERMWFLMSVTPLAGTESAGAVIMHVDVTDRRGAQRRLEESEAQYLLLLNSTAEGIYRLDVNGVCTFCNPTAARLLGCQNPGQIVGRSAHEHHHGRRPDGTRFPMHECKVHPLERVNEGAHADDEVFFRADGSQFPVEYWSYPILDGPDIAGTVVTFLDITRRRNLEAQFLQSQKMEAVGTLAGGVAHDFNNALQVILTYGELLHERLTHDPVGTEHNEQILRAGLRATVLTRQLLAVSRKQILRPVFLDLSTATSEIEEMLRRTIGEDITLTINRYANVGTIQADRGQIQQILINLAINARDAMPSGGELVISSSNFNIAANDVAPREYMVAGKYAMLSVRDTGAGIDQATQARIFEPFFTTKELGKGTGLGLSTAYGIVKQSKGYIVVDSEVGKGTEFRLFFPIVAGAADSILPPDLVQRPLRGSETILVVEDEDPLRMVVSDTLRAHGYTVLHARNGIEAIEAANAFAADIDLLLTDVILPGLSGRAVADRLQASRPSMKVIYMSGYTDEFIARHGIIDPEISLLEKPFPISLLLLTLRETLGGEPAVPANDD
jgi:PAS domain S-box-containing protein